MPSFFASTTSETLTQLSYALDHAAARVLGCTWIVATFVVVLGLIPAHAQEVTGPAYSVSYIEVMPKDEQKAAILLRKQAADMRKKPGNLEYIALQRDNPSRHFAIVEFWKDRGSLDAGRASEEHKAFVETQTPLLSAALDERPYVPMLDDLSRVRSALAGLRRNAVFIVTHVDVIPTKKDEGIAATKALFAPSGAEPGNAYYSVLQQSTRANHMTLFEIWKDRAALELHETRDFVRAYRQTLQPFSGALYDQRAYRALN